MNPMNPSAARLAAFAARLPWPHGVLQRLQALARRRRTARHGSDAADRLLERAAEYARSQPSYAADLRAAAERVKAGA